MVPAKSILIDLRTGYVWQPIGRPRGSADRYRVPVRRAEVAAPPMRNILRFIVCIIPCEAMAKTIAPAGRLPVAAGRCSFGAGSGDRPITLLVQDHAVVRSGYNTEVHVAATSIKA